MRQARRPPDPPVFVDRSGRRRRLMKLVGGSLGAALAAVLALMLAAMSGASRVQVPGFPDAGHNADAGASTPPPQPAPTAGITDPSAGNTAEISTSASTATASQTTKRRVPTQTPDHPRPSKTR